MNKEEADEIGKLISREGVKLKKYNYWDGMLLQVEKDPNEHTLEQFQAFKEREHCINMSIAIKAQLAQYANIVEQSKKIAKEQPKEVAIKKN